MTKRITAVALAIFIAIIPIMPAASQAPTFRDVPSSHPAYEAIRWVANPDNGAFMVGDAGNNFNPNRVLNVFDAASIFASAAGFRHITVNLPQAEREVFTRSFNTWRPLLENLATQHTQWNSNFDREIAFLLYHGILTVADVNSFVTTTGQVSSVSNLTRERAVSWIVRLLGSQSAAQALPQPSPNPFNDESSISQTFRRYMHYANNAGIIQATNGNINPTQTITRANMATLLFNALYEPIAPPPTQGQNMATVIGTIELILNNNIVVRTGVTTETLVATAGSVIMIDNVLRPLNQLQIGMQITALVNPQRNILSLVARSITQNAPQAPPSQNLNNDEGFVTVITANTITISTQRVRISGEVVNEERTFTVAATANITRGGVVSTLANAQPGDMAFFRFSGTMIHELTLVERERTIMGVLVESRASDVIGGNPIFTIEAENGRIYELRVTPATQFTRNGIQNLNWGDIRTGDSLVINTEYDRIASAQAIGIRTNVTGRLTEIWVRERNSKITLTLANGDIVSYVVVPGVFDIYSLRIGQTLNVMLDSREVIDINVQGLNIANSTTILGYIQTIHPNGNITVVEGQGSARRTVVLTINANTVITRAGVTINRNELRVNMNVHITIPAPQSTVAQSITVLP